VNLTRGELSALLATGTTPGVLACAEAVRRGAVYRIHTDTVTRDSALRIYALRAQVIRTDGVESIGVDEALKDLAASSYSTMRLGAVSGDRDYTLFMDPECRELIACMGVEGRTAR
jgi:hypothetical protein